jgi:hypothetical protein
MDMTGGLVEGTWKGGGKEKKSQKSHASKTLIIADLGWRRTEGLLESLNQGSLCMRLADTKYSVRFDHDLEQRMSEIMSDDTGRKCQMVAEIR